MIDATEGRPPRAAYFGDGALQPRTPAREDDDAEPSARMRSELGAFDGVGRQLMSDDN